MATIYDSTEVLQPGWTEKPSHSNTETSMAFSELENSIQIALETYSNVHRGSGHFSRVTTHLFEQARIIVLDYLKLEKSRYTVIFCSSRDAKIFKNQITPEAFHVLSSRDFGLALGVNALVVKKKELSHSFPFHVGGGTARLISKDWVVWAKSPDKFEAGTPAIINIIAFAKALHMIRFSGENIFLNTDSRKLTAVEILYNDELAKFSGRELLDKLRQTIIGRGISVPTMNGIVPFINLDNSASTPTFTPVWDVFRCTLKQPEQVRLEVIREVKSLCSGILGAPTNSYEIIFTSNATEAINLAAENFKLGFTGDSEPVVLNTLLEHSSNELPWRMIPGCSIIRLSVNAEGFVDLTELESLLIAYNQAGQYGKKRIKLVAISGASNVLGICQNIMEISPLVHRYSAHLLVDAAQLVAHRKIDMEGCGIDYLAFSAHKVYAPFGCGVLLVRKELIHFNSAELEHIQSSGEENAGGIAALGKALLLLQRIGMNLIQEEEHVLTERALRGLAQINDLELYGVKHPESSGFAQKLCVIVFGLKNKISTQVGKELALYGGIGVRTGCHCAHITVKHILQVGPGLEKFQKLIVTLFPNLSLPGVVRISFGIENTTGDVDTFIQVLETTSDKPKTTTESATNGKVKKQIAKFIKNIEDRVYN